MSGPEDFAKFFADKGIDVNQDNDKQWPPLIYICRGDRGGDPVVVKRLIDLGINVNVCNYKGKTALHVAAKSGFVPATQLLLDHGAQVNALDPNGETAMFDLIRSAIQRTEWQLGVLSLLLENGAEVSIRNKHGQTVLDLARDPRRKIKPDLIAFLEKALADHAQI